MEHTKQIAISIIGLSTMAPDEFQSKIRQAVPVGTVLNNPGGGTSEIIQLSDNKISYLRGSSTISVSFDDLFSAYSHFRGKRVSSSDLRAYAPSIFDSAARPAGHSCNCTFLLLILVRIDLADSIAGTGVRGDPYTAVFRD